MTQIQIVDTIIDGWATAKVLTNCNYNHTMFLHNITKYIFAAQKLKTKNIYHVFKIY